MRVAILTAVSAALCLAALPAAAHGYSSYEEEDSVEYNCPIPQPVHHHVHHMPHHIVHRGCPVAMLHHPMHHLPVISPPGPVQGPPREQFGEFHPQGPWVHGWHDHMAGGAAPPGCQGFDLKHPEGHRMIEEHGMRCHEEGPMADRGLMGGRFGYSREEEDQMSSGHRGWHEDGGWWGEQVSMTDQYGYLTWPGKTHIRPMAGPPEGPPMEGPPPGRPPEGPLGPPPGAYPPGPPPIGMGPQPDCPCWKVHP